MSVEAENAIGEMDCIKLDQIDQGSCMVCLTAINDPINLGDFYKCGEITSHYFCLLFSAQLVQNGEDQEGILGFYPKDIREEIRRGRRLRCVYCKKNGATVGCSVKTCRKTFHLPCGVQAGSLHQFFDSFRSFCANHRPQQKVPREAFQEVFNSKECPICYDPVETKVSNTTLWAPCCRKRWFHRICIQRLAVTSGYFFKCPLCNNKECFSAEMRKSGIYIPAMDAAWELEPNAFTDLLHTHNTCDANPCNCPNGRNFSVSIGSWRILRCNACGSQGTHLACGGFKIKVARNAWRCPACTSILTPKSSSHNSSSLVLEPPSSLEPPNRVQDPSLTTPDATTSLPEPIEISASSSSSSSSSPKRMKLDDINTDKNEGSSSNEDNIIIVVDSDDSDLEVLEVLPHRPKLSSRGPSVSGLCEGVDKELLTNEGKTIKVHKVQARDDKIPELGGVVCKSVQPIPTPSNLIPKKETAPECVEIRLGSSVPPSPNPTPKKETAPECVELRLGSSVSLFPVPSSSSHPTPKIPHLREVNIFPVPSPPKPLGRELKITSPTSSEPSRSQRSVNAVASQSSSTVCSDRKVESAEHCDIKINDVRHSNEFFQSIHPMHPISQGPIIPIVYYPITTNDGRSALQPMLPLQPVALPSLPLQQNNSTPDVVTLD